MKYNGRNFINITTKITMLGAIGNNIFAFYTP